LASSWRRSASQLGTSCGQARETRKWRRARPWLKAGSTPVFVLARLSPLAAWLPVSDRSRLRHVVRVAIAAASVTALCGRGRRAPAGAQQRQARRGRGRLPVSRPRRVAAKRRRASTTACLASGTCKHRRSVAAARRAKQRSDVGSAKRALRNVELPRVWYALELVDATRREGGA
jgi:hypothetical protein